MKKIIVLCLLIIFAMGNICFAQSAAAERDHHTYYVGTGQDGLYNPQPLYENRHYRHHHRHYRHHRHHRHHNHDDDDFAEDVVKGIIILGIAHEVFD